MQDVQSMEEILLDLGKNLLRSLVFYIPNSLSEYLDEEGKVLWEEHANRLVLIENNGSNYFVEDKLACHHIMSKSMLLSDNLFKLMELRGELKEESLGYLLKKYGQQVEGCVLMSQWFLDNWQRDIPEITKDQQKALDVQLKSFQAHFDEFKSHFGTYILDKKDVNELRHEVLEKWKKQIFPKNVATVLPTPPKQKPNKVTKSEERKQRLDKVREIAMLNAKEQILSQIFKVKFREA
ncbi:hypothetical protein [Mangrovimonas aestuarii]|uniref:hypothetical protein n=1 Tax=Mangrovimonas aestuarii TaxID=3018443 RepID=UPI002378DB29|nr:hypothetical protein [Mangrovimonas aestuarii]